MQDKTTYFLNLVKRSRKGRLKIYIGMSPGVGKTYRMLQEAHTLLKNGVDVWIGYIETHGRTETQALVHGLPFFPRTKMFYKGKELEEMDLQNMLVKHPEVVIVDELAHTNIPGSKNEKRWQDVQDLLEKGINVISAVNIQHIESINKEVQEIAGIEIRERVPDKVLQWADEVVNIDMTAEDLIGRLKEGKIYHPSKIPTALQHFFQPDKILQLRELALKEVAHLVERKIDTEIQTDQKMRIERFLACISSNNKSAADIIRKTARLSAYYNASWYVLYVQTPKENPDQIKLSAQRHLLNNLKLATELGAEIIRVKATDLPGTIVEIAMQKEITTICIGKPVFKFWNMITRRNLFIHLLNRLKDHSIDIIILSK